MDVFTDSVDGPAWAAAAVAKYVLAVVMESSELEEASCLSEM